jgi:capsular polysaccharide biosynthesis protein/MinD-like ATPase involved in chromosome partitioning or flagellar assembly
VDQDNTLAGYLGVLRRGLPIIAVTAAVCAIAAFTVSKLITPSYQASASLAMQDPNEALALTGSAAGLSTQTQLQLALSHAPQVTRPQVVQAVRARLRNGMTSDALLRAVSVSVNPNSALIDITASSQSATRAAAIANAFAQEDTAVTTAQTRRQYALQASQLAKRLSQGSAAQDPGTKLLYETQLERLQTLGSVATPVEVNSTARVPSAPASPKPLRNTLAALVFGLLLGVALTYGREALERRLRQPSDVEEILDEPIVGHIRYEALGHAGAHSPGSVNGTAPLEPADEESFRVLRQNVRYFTTDPVRTVLVSSAAAQEGKSTVAACLAATTVAAGQRTLLVECDLRRPVLAKRLGLPDGPGITDYLTGNAGPSDIVRVVPTIHPGMNGGANPGKVGSMSVDQRELACITAGTLSPRPAELLASDAFGSFVSEISQAYDSVIIDSAPLLAVADTLEIVPRVSAVLLCVRLRKTTREELRAARAALSRLPARPLGVVVTGLQKRDADYYGYYSGYYAAAAAERR